MIVWPHSEDEANNSTCVKVTVSRVIILITLFIRYWKMFGLYLHECWI